MTPNFGQAARRVLGESSGSSDTSEQIADRAARACEQLTKHLARLIGESGVELLLRRSIVVASARISWLAAAAESSDMVTGVRSVWREQDPAAITESFVATLSTFVGLLERLIGAGLVDRLLQELWPDIFLDVAKDTP